MGTRGLRIIRFRGRYWSFYNQLDSHPHGLGQWLVDSIPTDPEQYRKWLQSQRDTYAKWDSLLHQFLTIQPEDMRKLLTDGYQTPVFWAAFDDRLLRDAPPYHVLGFNDIIIKWTYTIDLDREIFSVNSAAHFHLNRIPRNEVWSQALFKDTYGSRFLLPQLVPAESVATLVLDPPIFAVSTKYAKLQTRLVKPKNLDGIPPSQLTGPKLRWELFNIFQESQQANLSVNLLGWQAQDLPFRELTFFILCLAAGGEHLALLDQRRIIKPYPGALYLGLTTNDSSEPDIELATCLGVGYHMAGLPIGSAPGESKYWLEGALICLVPRLDYPGILEEAIADAIEYGRAECTASSFHAVLISIEHLVLLRSFPNGTVDHTEVLPLVHIYSHRSKGSHTRYDEQALEAFYAGHCGQKKIQENEEDQIINDDEEEDDAESIEPLPIRDVSIRATFMALVLFFETTILETLRPIQQNEARLPDEICELVLRNVSDIKTYNSCLKVSRRFRLICQQRTLVMDDLEFLEPLPQDQVTASSPKKKTRDRQPQPDFLAMDMASDRRMDVSLRSGNNYRSGNSCGDALTCSVVAGNEWNKKTFANTCIVFQGLRLPLAGADEAGNREPSTDTHGNHQDLAMPDDKSHPWEFLLRAYKIDVETSTGGLADFWSQATDMFIRPLSWPRQPAWTLPPNTHWYFGTKTSFGSTAGLDDFSSDGPESQIFRHYFYLRLQRVGKYCGDQWEAIIREATDHLNQPDHEEIKSKKYPINDVIGADEPYVILTVGPDVRLFRWQQGFDGSVDDDARRKMSPSSFLRELTPDKILSLLARSDIEEIETFLQQAEQHGDAIKAREVEKWGGKRKWY